VNSFYHYFHYFLPVEDGLYQNPEANKIPKLISLASIG
jgi:hypothetical protein